MSTAVPEKATPTKNGKVFWTSQSQPASAGPIVLPIANDESTIPMALPVSLFGTIDATSRGTTGIKYENPSSMYTRKKSEVSCQVGMNGYNIIPAVITQHDIVSATGTPKRFTTLFTTRLWFKI